MLNYGIYRFVLPDSAGVAPLGPLVMDQFDGWRFDPMDKSLILEFVVPPAYHEELRLLGIPTLAQKIRKKLRLRPEVCIRFRDARTQLILVENQDGRTHASK